MFKTNWKTLLRRPHVQIWCLLQQHCTWLSWSLPDLSLNCERATPPARIGVGVHYLVMSWIRTLPGMMYHVTDSHCHLNGEDIKIQPQEGSFLFGNIRIAFWALASSDREGVFPHLGLEWFAAPSEEFKYLEVLFISQEENICEIDRQIGATRAAGNLQLLGRWS